MNWYIAYVRSCQERNVAATLEKMGVRAYVPVQTVVRQWSDRKVRKQQLVLPRLVFVYCEDVLRKRLLEDVAYLSSFMMDRASSKLAVVSEEQMQRFMAVVGGSPDPVRIRQCSDFAPGQMVRVGSGPLKGLECEVLHEDSNSYVAVRLGILGAAVTKIDANLLELI